MQCIICKNDHDGSFGSGKFCCRACSNSRIRSPEVRKKIGTGVKNSIISGKSKKPIRKGIKLKPRTPEHSKKIVLGIVKRWDEKGRKTDNQKKAGNKANVYAYRARKKNAIPIDANLPLIKAIYELVPAGYQVDHIIPLARGGFHHQNNLQYLPSKENQRKGSKLDFVSEQAIRWQDILI